MNRRYMIVILVVGIALFLGSRMLNLGAAFGRLGVVLIVFASGALLWETLRPRRGV